MSITRENIEEIDYDLNINKNAVKLYVAEYNNDKSIARSIAKSSFSINVREVILKDVINAYQEVINYKKNPLDYTTLKTNTHVLAYGDDKNKITTFTSIFKIKKDESYNNTNYAYLEFLYGSTIKFKINDASIETNIKNSIDPVYVSNKNDCLINVIELNDDIEVDGNICHYVTSDWVILKFYEYTDILLNVRTGSCIGGEVFTTVEEAINYQQDLDAVRTGRW